MPSPAFPLLTDVDAAEPLQPASEMLRALAAPSPALDARLTRIYGPDSATSRGRIRAARTVLERFLEVHGDRPCALFRAPARLSLNPHSDHQGAWVPYGLHIRELLAVASPIRDEPQFEISNTDRSCAPRLEFSLPEAIARAGGAWHDGWLPAVESPGVVDEVRRNLDPKGTSSDRRGLLNYVQGAALRLAHLYPEVPLPGLRLTFHGDIPQGGGQSSSSAVIVATMLALAHAAGLPLDRRQLAEHCGEAEWYVGTRGGSGDHAAMLLGDRGGLIHLRFRAQVGIRDAVRSPFPAGFELLLANSRLRSEKSAEERLLFNRGIFAYRFAFLALREAMAELGLPAPLIAATECLGDLHTGRLTPELLYELICRIPVTVGPAELAERFPAAFGPAARGCFGTEDPQRLPDQIPLRGAAVYGLGRADRGRVMPELLTGGSDAAMREFGELMSITHDGDRLYRDGAPYREGQERLSNEALLRAAAAGQPLRREPGFYGASTPELDRIVDAATQVQGVYGAGLMGAGGGGYVVILAKSGTLDAVRAALTREYYGPTGREPDVEAWHPTAAACRLV